MRPWEDSGDIIPFNVEILGAPLIAYALWVVSRASWSPAIRAMSRNVVFARRTGGPAGDKAFAATVENLIGRDLSKGRPRRRSL